MTSRLKGHAVHRLLFISSLALLAAMLVIPHAASQETRTLALDVVIAEESFEFIPALGNQITEETFIARGDIITGQGPVYAAGDAGGERIGTFYFMAVGTAQPEHFETAANHIYAVAHFELFGEGTLAVTGVVSFVAPSYLTITGGTGIYAMASGQCTDTPTEDLDHWECEVH